MKECLLMLINNLKILYKLPIKRLPWKIEMIILDTNCEIGEFIRIYKKLDKEKKLENLKK